MTISKGFTISISGYLSAKAATHRSSTRINPFRPRVFRLNHHMLSSLELFEEDVFPNTFSVWYVREGSVAAKTHVNDGPMQCFHGRHVAGLLAWLSPPNRDDDANQGSLVEHPVA